MLAMSLLVLIIVPDDLQLLPVMSGGGQTTQVSRHWYLFFTIKLYLFLFIFIYKAPARSEKIEQKRGEERACVFVGFSNEGWGLSKPNQGFPNRGGQKMGQK